MEIKSDKIYRRRWTDEEMQFLAENFQKDIDFLSRKLQRTSSAIYIKLNNMGLSRIKKWTTEEEKHILNDIISQKFDKKKEYYTLRSKSAIRVKLTRLYKKIREMTQTNIMMS